MAGDRGRDLKFAILSDADKFDLSDPADELDDLGRSAEDTGRRLDDLADDAQKAGRSLESDLARDTRDAGRDLDALGDDARQTAKQVDTAFEQIAASSRSNFRKTGDAAQRGMRDASAATDEFRDEAKQNVSEVASSFDGSMDSIRDVVQGTLGGVVSNLGAVGIAGAAAGALAVGAIFKMAEETREKIRELSTEFAEAALTGRGLSEDVLTGRIRDRAVEDAAAFTDLAKKISLAGVSQRDFFRAQAGDADALRRVTEQLEVQEERYSGLSYAAGTMTDEQGKAQRATSELQRELGITAEALDIVDDATRAFNESTGASVETLEAYADAAGDVASSNDDLAQATEAAARRKARATKDESDAWTDYADTAVASIDDVIRAQERDIKAALDFQANSEAVFAAVGEAGVQWALDQGENADKAMQLLADAPKSKQQQVVDNYQRSGEISGDSFVTGLDSKQPAIETEAETIHTSIKSIFGRPVEVRVNLTTPSQDRIWQVRRQIEASLSGITVPVAPGIIRAEASERFRQ